MSFDNIIGHENIKFQINNSLLSGRFAHAHIIVGEDGLGKSIIAKETGFKILGKPSNNQCVDMIEFKIPKNKKSIGINEIKELIEEINKKPYEGDKKVIVLYSADFMTTEAQNSFLKTIEEPPEGVFIILLCENLENVLDTIKSRCQIYKLHRLSKSDMRKYLENKYPNMSSEELQYIISFSDSIPGRAEKFIEDDSLKDIRNITIDILKNMNEKSFNIEKYEILLVKYKGNWQETLTWLIAYIRDVLVYKETGNEKLIINIDKIKDIKTISAIFSFTKLNNIVEIIKSTRKKLDRNVNIALVFDSMLLKFREV